MLHLHAPLFHSSIDQALPAHVPASSQALDTASPSTMTKQQAHCCLNTVKMSVCPAVEQTPAVTKQIVAAKGCQTNSISTVEAPFIGMHQASPTEASKPVAHQHETGRVSSKPIEWEAKSPDGQANVVQRSVLGWARV
jgi:hypothetical protein